MDAKKLTLMCGQYVDLTVDAKGMEDIYLF